MAKVPNDREDPRDANPLFNRLPAEVISRRRPHQRSAEEPAQGSVDFEGVLSRKPDGRAKWLIKALQQAEDGVLAAHDIYDVVANHRFAEGLTDKAGRKAYRALHAKLEVFSSKQKKFLKDCSLAKLYAATAWAGAQKEDADDQATQTKTNGLENKSLDLEEMMARCRAFVREKQEERGERGKDGDGDGQEGNAEDSAEPLAATNGVTEPSVADPEPLPATAGISSGSHIPDSKVPEKEDNQAKEKQKSKDRDAKKEPGKTRSKNTKREVTRRKKKASSSSSPSPSRRRSSSSSSSHRHRARRRKARSSSSSSSCRQDKKRRR